MSDAADSRAPKRPRLEHEGSSSSVGSGIKPEPSEPKSLEGASRDEELWLDDGNIVLVAGDTMFKVYRGLLAAQSPIFGDVFAVASSSRGAHFDNVPTVRLTDSPEDLKHLLRALVPTTQRRCASFLRLPPTPA